MEWTAVATLTVTIVLAFAGYVAKYINDVRIEQRRARLERVNRQLSEFYGPLLSLSYAGGVAWAAADADIRPDDKAPFSEREFSESEAETFRLWMTNVLMPMNRQLVELILRKADLLEGDKMPRVLLEVCANVLAFEAVLKRWEQRDYTRTWSFVPYPGEQLREYANESFADLKGRQAQLLQELNL